MQSLTETNFFGLTLYTTNGTLQLYPSYQTNSLSYCIAHEFPHIASVVKNYPLHISIIRQRISYVVSVIWKEDIELYVFWEKLKNLVFIMKDLVGYIAKQH